MHAVGSAERRSASSSYGVEAYKVASADLTNHELLEAIAATGKPLIVSTGMSFEWEIEQAVRLLQSRGAQYVLLNCNSTYPTPFKDVQLRYMDRLAQIGGCLVGYSGHERGFAVPIAAVARGAKVIEKHITLDRAMEGNDHKVSLLPEEFRAMVEGIRAVEEALGTGAVRQVSQGERMNRSTLAKSLIAGRDIEPGEVITDDMIAVKSPGRGLQPNRRHELVGKVAQRALAQGSPLLRKRPRAGGGGGAKLPIQAAVGHPGALPRRPRAGRRSPTRTSSSSTSATRTSTSASRTS